MQGQYNNGAASNVIHSFSPTVEPGFKIVKGSHTKSAYLKMLTKTINKMTTRLVDDNGKLLSLTGGKVRIIYHIRSKK